MWTVGEVVYIFDSYESHATLIKEIEITRSAVFALNNIFLTKSTQQQCFNTECFILGPENVLEPLGKARTFDSFPKSRSRFACRGLPTPIPSFSQLRLSIS
jgi:hypothetical protein